MDVVMIILNKQFARNLKFLEYFLYKGLEKALFVINYAPDFTTFHSNDPVSGFDQKRSVLNRIQNLNLDCRHLPNGGTNMKFLAHIHMKEKYVYF